MARRRTSVINALLRYRDGNLDDTLMISDHSTDDEATSSSQVWRCTNCPIILTNGWELRITDPCGHVYCVDCSKTIVRCVVRNCQKKITKVIKPNIQEGEPINEEAEAEKERVECFAIKDKLRRLDDEVASLIAKKKHREKTRNARESVQQTLLDTYVAQKFTLDRELTEADLKVKLAKFMSSIENGTQFPVVNKGDKCKAYYLKTAIETSKYFREINHAIQKELTDDQHRLYLLNREKETLENAIREVVSKGQEYSDDPNVWTNLEKIASNIPINCASAPPITKNNAFRKRKAESTSQI